MRLFVCALLLCATGSLAACGGGGGAAISDNTNRAAASAPERPSANAPPSAPAAAPPVASSHGGAAPDGTAAAERERTIVDTAALDAKIARALAKAKAPRAGAADRKAAALAYFERGNVYWSAGNPSLYKFALADFKSVLVYEPGNAEAEAKRDEIIRIYSRMNRPVPELSNEK